VITENDILVLNETSVIPARLFGTKETGGKVEVMLEKIIEDNRTLVQIKSSRSIKKKSSIHFMYDGQTFSAICLGRQDKFYLLKWDDDPTPIFLSFGTTPLPPYINRATTLEDQLRYQTVYANKRLQQSVAAPTAGLHFDLPMLNELEKTGLKIRYLSLHVGAGTYTPVTSEDITKHKMHAEEVAVDRELVQEILSVKQQDGKVFAVGTTTLRALEATFLDSRTEFKGSTDLFIYPGFQFKVVDYLLTNFHQPKSSLLMLVAAFIGLENLKKIYAEAIEMQYRFLSYGDAMLLERHDL
jgi:S-adenosylmethionine:tRNA ribosyltransferase-isomerase